MGKKYRKLSETEIATLTAAGCTARSWADVEVADGFSAAHVAHVRFGGRVRLGANGGAVVDRDGVTRTAGIRCAAIIDCTIGDNVLIENIGTYISSYTIGDDAVIEDTGRIVCTGRGAFGNGVRAAAVNEGGGREVAIHDALSAQAAYLAAMYRHRPGLSARIEQIVDRHIADVDPSFGIIGRGAHVSGCGTLRDVRIGEYARVDGAAGLENGTVGSSREAPTHVGTGVTARDFIVSHGAHIDNGASVERCFVGEACRLDHGFTAVDSLFFADCDCANGEACSVFAGPFTVSHHKSSLLIAGIFSFFNAGSGANQSNHMFKTGAVHQGVHERGCKFASNAYVMLPAREGPFTVVVGRHTAHHDTSEFPFSYLTEEGGRSYLAPGINLRSSGLARDLAKWPGRDRRTGPRRDRVDFDEHNPWIGGRLLGAIDRCEQLLASPAADHHTVNRVRIKDSMLRKGLSLYRLALDTLLASLLDGVEAGIGDTDLHWIDAAGMTMPRRAMEDIADAIEAGGLDSVEAIEARFDAVHAARPALARRWALGALAHMLGREPGAGDIAGAVARGHAAAEQLRALRADDAAKDSSDLMATGYGIDSLDDEDVIADFKVVRKV